MAGSCHSVATWPLVAGPGAREGCRVEGVAHRVNRAAGVWPVYISAGVPESALAIEQLAPFLRLRSLHYSPGAHGYTDYPYYTA
jgi:hypothetical protein